METKEYEVTIDKNDDDNKSAFSTAVGEDYDGYLAKIKGTKKSNSKAKPSTKKGGWNKKASDYETQQPVGPVITGQ
jgi:hypothetical protein